VAVRRVIAYLLAAGYPAGSDGRTLSFDSLRHFSCRFNGEVVFSAELHPAIAANPYLAFPLRATTSGTLSFTWEGDHGFAQTETATLTVT
jgi:sulfur-oxidizing protein SoxZ